VPDPSKQAEGLPAPQTFIFFVFFVNVHSENCHHCHAKDQTHATWLLNPLSDANLVFLSV
jgi:hypothetical protein